MMNLQPGSNSFIPEFNGMLSRRQFFRKNAMGLGVAALSSLLGPRVFGQPEMAG